MNVLRWLLMPLAGLYGVVIRGRNLYYDRGRRAVRSVAIPVVSVGNITVGGTGKTPLVIELVRRLRALGRQPAILTRGYKAIADRAADEVQELRDALPDVPVVVNPDRMAGAATAESQHQADCLVLDDGFQHRRLARDLDIVLIDALEPWGGRRLLPAGRLREPLSGLRRADLLVITRCNQVEPAAVQAIDQELRRWAGEKPVIQGAVEADALVHRDGRRVQPAELGGRRVLAVCGLGNPRTFEKLISSLTGAACKVLVFADHHRYTPADVRAIDASAARAGAELVVTTRKDWVKLMPLWSDTQVELARLDIRLVLTGATEDLDVRLRQVVEKQP
jgi:tetraacyldisaccharide 4'-kinase